MDVTYFFFKVPEIEIFLNVRMPINDLNQHIHI